MEWIPRDNATLYGFRRLGVTAVMKKLIILGAGANADFGFPTGIGLSKSIHSLWRTPNDGYVNFLLNSLTKYGQGFAGFDDERTAATTLIKRLSDRFFYAGAESIDDFLSQPLKNFEVSFGKLTILKLILEKEREALLADSDNNLFKWENNWLRVFFGLEFRFENKNKLDEKLTQNPVKFITFNYDRSLEYFIFTAIKNYYGLETKDAVSIYKKIEFYHVYGKLAPLDWELDDPNGRLKFGDDFKDFPYNQDEKIYRCTSNIKVINEDRSNFETIKEKCKAWIQESDRVYVLGFGFLDSNYQLLGIDEYKKSVADQRVPLSKFYYTTFGLSENQKANVVRKFGSRPEGSCRAQSYDLKIYDYMLHHYS